jgi:hypothetical protein
MLNPFVTTRIVITQCCACVLGTYHPAIKMISRAPSGSILILIVVIVIIIIITGILLLIIMNRSMMPRAAFFSCSSFYIQRVLLQLNAAS